MNRRKLLQVLGLPAFLALGSTVAAAATRGRNPYYDGPPSDHFDGVRFFVPGRPEPRGFLDFLRWQLGGGRVSWPELYPGLAPDRPPRRVGGLRAVHLGHASLLYQTGGLNVLVDPVLSERASPVGFAGPRRVNAPGIAVDDLPPIDVVLVTHNHYDHMDAQTLTRLWLRDRPRIITPLGNDKIIGQMDGSPVAEAYDWGARIALNDKVFVQLEPAYHWSARSLTDRRMALWASFILSTPAGLVYHVGDTAYFTGEIFRKAAERFGGFALAVLPIGAYEPRWFMADNHMNPAEAVQVFKDLNARMALGHHWGTFQLTNEGIEEPIEALSAALKASNIPAERFKPLRPGFIWTPASS